MKKKIFLLLLLLLIKGVLTLQITEVELNPSGSDSGNEWIEFYSEKEVDLGEYKIINNDGDEIKLSGKVKGFYVYVFEKQWLDNSDEKIILYKGNEKIQETLIFEDSKNNELTWQFCDKWEFKTSTKGKENCEKQTEEKEEPQEDQEEAEEEVQEQKDPQEESNEKNSTKKPKQIRLEEIKLNAKDIKRDKILDKKEYAIVVLVILTIIVIFLLIKKWHKIK